MNWSPETSQYRILMNCRFYNWSINFIWEEIVYDDLGFPTKEIKKQEIFYNCKFTSGLRLDFKLNQSEDVIEIYRKLIVDNTFTITGTIHYTLSTEIVENDV